MGAACCYDVIGDGVSNAVHKRKGHSKGVKHHDDDNDDDDSDMHVIKDLVKGQVPGKPR